MQRGFKIILSSIVALIVVLLPLEAEAQTSSINAYSPYSMYGPGELLTPGNVQMRSMGGVGIGLRATNQINTQNPAAASIMPRKSFLFDVSVDGTHYRNNQMKFDASGAESHKAKTAYNTANIHNISLAFPLAKGLGATVSVAPYSSVGYKMQITDQNNDNWADIGRVVYGYSGEGDITEVKVAVGWAIHSNFSIGIAAKYFWGNIDRTYTTSIPNVVTGEGNFASTKGTERSLINNFKLQAGLQWNIIANDKRMLTLGATYDMGGKLNPKVQHYVYTDNTINSIQGTPVRNDLSTLELRVPHEFGVGVYYLNRMLAFGVDYKYSAWGSNNNGYVENANSKDVAVVYTNTHTIKAGFEITPKRTDVRNYLNRMTYRVGARLGNYYQTFAGERINQMAVTAGIGFPVKLWGASSINLGFEYGRMSSHAATQLKGMKVGLVTQNYYKLSLGFTLFSHDTADYWFVRQKFD